MSEFSGKQKTLKSALEEFHQSSESTETYMTLFATLHSVLKQGSGLSWTQIEDVVEDVIKK